jgi:hypothetical protein
MRPTLSLGLALTLLLLPAASTSAAQSATAPTTPAPSSDDEPQQSITVVGRAAGSTSPNANSTISGTVFCADTHRPARGALVMLTPIPSADGKRPDNESSTGFTRVALDGAYTLRKVQPGESAVIALYPGYLSPMDDLGADAIGPSTPATLAKQRDILERFGAVTVAANSSASFDVTLQRGATVTGQVLYSDGAPASQVTIDLEDIHAKPSTAKSPLGDIDGAALARSLFTHQAIGTDDQGNFRISGIKPGTYRVAAVQAAPADSDPTGMSLIFGNLMGLSKDGNSLRVYAGDTLHKNAAETFELRAGDELPGIDINIPLNAFHHVSGTLTAKDGRSLNSATLTLTDTTDDSFKFTTTLTTEGAFTFATVPSGTYTLSATKARILVAAANTARGVPFEYLPKHTANAFADASTSLIVKDSDLDDVTLPLAEIPVPPNADKENSNPFGGDSDVTPDPPPPPPK